MPEPITLPEDPRAALEAIQGYLLTATMRPDRAVIKDGELVGYWQCTDWLLGLEDIANEIPKLIAKLPPTTAR